MTIKGFIIGAVLGFASISFAQISTNPGQGSVTINNSPGGSNTQIQFNDSNAFGGDSGLTWNKSTHTLTATNIVGNLPITLGDTQVAFGNGANTIGGDAGLTWDRTNGALQIGGVGAEFSSQSQLTIASDATTTPSDNSIFSIFGADDIGATILGYVAGGTLASPTTAIDDDPLLIRGYAYATGGYALAGQLSIRQDGAVSGSNAPGKIDFRTSDASGNINSVLILRANQDAEFSGNILTANGKAIQTDTTTAHTALFQAYDVDGAAYKTFGTLTNGNTPSFDLSAPSGGLLTGNFTTLQVASVNVATVLTGTTGSIGGGLLSVACTSGTATVSGVTTGMGIIATPVTYPGDGVFWHAYRSGSNEVTVKVCTDAAITPTATAYNVRVIP